MLTIKLHRLVIFGVASVTLVLLAITAIGIWRLSTVQRNLAAVVAEHERHGQLAGTMLQAGQLQLQVLQQLATTRLAERQKPLYSALQHQTQRFDATARQLQDSRLEPPERLLLEQVTAAVPRARPLLDEVAALYRAGRRDHAGRMLLEQAIPAQRQVLLPLQDFLAGQARRVHQAVLAAGDQYQRTVAEMLLLCLLGVSLAIIIGGRVARRIIRIMDSLEEMVTRLRHSRSRERAIRMHMLDGMITADREGVIRSANPAVEALFGYRKGELIGEKLNILMPEPHRTVHDDYLHNYLTTGQTRIIGQGREVTGLHKDGSEIPLELGVAHLTVDDEHLFVGILHDLRHRKENERLLNEAKHRLENQVAQRTRELQESNTRLLAEVAERKEAQRQLALQARHDALTGLANRRLFQDRLEQAESAARRHDGSLSVMYLDLDGFKAVNDRLGHHAGDQLLKIIAERLRNQLRQEDLVARLGGDEFAVLLEQIADRDQLAQVASKLIAAVAEPARIGGQVVEVGVSIGIARYPADANASSKLLRRADQAMYEAKNAGRGRYRFWQAESRPGC